MQQWNNFENQSTFAEVMDKDAQLHFYYSECNLTPVTPNTTIHCLPVWCDSCQPVLNKLKIKKCIVVNNIFQVTGIHILGMLSKFMDFTGGPTPLSLWLNPSLLVKKSGNIHEIGLDI